MPPLGLLEEADVLAVGAGEAALLVAEQLALDQARRDRAAVDREEMLAAAPAQVVDGLRHHFLAGAAFAADQHRRRGARDPRHLVVDPAHRRRTAPQLPEVTVLVDVGVEVADFAVERRRRRQTRQHRAQLAFRNRLLQVIGRSQAQRVQRRIERRMAGHQNDFGFRQPVGLVQQLHAAAVGKLEVDENDVGPLQRDLAVRFAQGARGRHGEAFTRDQRGHAFRSSVVTINDKYVSHWPWRKRRILVRP